MKRPQPISVSPPLSTDSDRDRMEIIRFSTADDQRHAIRALMDRGMLSFSSDREDEWLVRTSVARKLRELAVPFQWLTEHA